MGDVTGKFIRPMIALYGEIGTDDEDLVFALYEKTLGGFPDPVLACGFEIVAGSYMPSKRNPWPAPAICKKACEKAASEAAAQSGALPKRAIDPEWSDGRFAEADRMIRCELGEQAAREGWVSGLHDFCRRHRRLPKPIEIPKMMETARFIERAAAGMITEETPNGDRPVQVAGAMAEAFVRMAHGFLATREKLAKQVLGDAA